MPSAFNRRRSMRRLCFCILVPALTIVALTSLGAQQPLGPATDRLVASLDIESSLRLPLRAALRRSLVLHRCVQPGLVVRLVDLNGDYTPEVYVSTLAPCESSYLQDPTERFNWVFMLDTLNKRAREVFADNWQLVSLGSRTGRFVDIAAGVPFAGWVWRWNGTAYEEFCRWAEGTDDLSNLCRMPVATHQLGGGLPPFPGNGAPQICGERGRFAVFAVRSLKYAPGIGLLDADSADLQVLHEQVFFCDDGFVMSNFGFTDLTREDGEDGMVFSERSEMFQRYRVINAARFDPQRMMRAVEASRENLAPYGLWTHNCQDWASDVRRRYHNQPPRPLPPGSTCTRTNPTGAAPRP
jgi:hypothetical protein